MSGPLDAKRRLIEDEINAELAKLHPLQSPDDLVARMLPPGWEYVSTTPLGGPPRIALTQYSAPDMFEDRGPLAHKGRNSIPRSHRGEGFNYVD